MVAKREVDAVSEPLPARFLFPRNPDGGQFQVPAFGPPPSFRAYQLERGR